MEKEKEYVLPYGGDTRDNGTALGPGAKLREKRLIDFIVEHPLTRWVILLAPGHHPMHRDWPMLKVITEKSVTEKLSELYQSGKITYIPEIVLMEDDVWNSSNESVAVARFLEKRNVHKLYIRARFQTRPNKGTLTRSFLSLLGFI